MYDKFHAVKNLNQWKFYKKLKLLNFVIIISATPSVQMEVLKETRHQFFVKFVS